ncbi:MAG: hypothetical protein ACPL1K_05425 [Candidatus Kryptoniota bacterium]
MKKKLAIILVAILFSAFSILPLKAWGWAGVPVAANHHGEMTRDTLMGLIDSGLLAYSDIGL